MSGRWRVGRPRRRHDHFIIETDNDRRIALNDARRFGSLDLVRTSGLQDWPPFQGARAGAARPRRARAEAPTGWAHRGGQAAAARPAHRRGPRQYLCLRRCTAPASIRAAQADLRSRGWNSSSLRSTASPKRSKARRVCSRFRQSGRGAGLFLPAVCGVRSGREAVRVRRHRQARRPGGARPSIVPSASVDLRGAC